jgi:hypothetical protein
MEWFRTYHADPRNAWLEALDDAEFRVWWRLRNLASAQPADRRGSIPPMSQTALAVGVARGDQALLERAIGRLVDFGLLAFTEDGGLAFVGWQEEQTRRASRKPSDAPEAVRERVRRHRERSLPAPAPVTPVTRGNAPVTRGNAPVTPPRVTGVTGQNDAPPSPDSGGENLPSSREILPVTPVTPVTPCNALEEKEEKEEKEIRMNTVIASRDAMTSHDAAPDGAASPSPPLTSRVNGARAAPAWPDHAWIERAFAERFWPLYPRKTHKAAASVAFARRMKRHPTFEAAYADLEHILEVLVEQAKYWTDPALTPHAATYLNGRRDEDEIIIPTGRAGAQPAPRPYRPR